MKKIGVIAAMSQEMAFLLAALQDKQENHMAGFTFITGHMHDKQIILVQSGMGKVNAAVTATLLEQIYQPEAVINIGVAGGVHSGIKIGDIILADQMVYHDVDVRAFDYAYGQVPRMPATYLSDEKLLTLAASCAQDVLHLTLHKGLVASGDCFVTDEVQIKHASEHFDTIFAVDMESAAIAQVCHRFSKPFAVIRAISDMIAGDKNEELFYEHLQTATKNSSDLALAMLARL